MQASGLLSKVIDDKFRIDAILGTGGMGVVYKAWQLGLERAVALKMISAQELAQNDMAVQRLAREAQALSTLRHRNVAAFCGYGVWQGHPYFCMEYVEGVSLDKVLSNKTLSTAEIVQIFIELCQGLGHAHAHGIIHRDLKPGNIIVLKDTEGQYCPRIIDFGLAMLQGSEHAQKLTQPGTVTGTAAYLSPEQCQAGEIDQRSDIYSLGCVFYECLTGKPPFYGQSVGDLMQQHVSRLPKSLFGDRCSRAEKDLETIVFKTLAKKPEQRYQTSAELQLDLETWLQSCPPGFRLSDRQSEENESDKTRSSSKSKIRPRTIGIACLAVAALCLMMVVIGTDLPSKVKQGIPFLSNMAHFGVRSHVLSDALLAAQTLCNRKNYDQAESVLRKSLAEESPGDAPNDPETLAQMFDLLADLTHKKLPTSTAELDKSPLLSQEVSELREALKYHLLATPHKTQWQWEKTLDRYTWLLILDHKYQECLDVCEEQSALISSIEDKRILAELRLKQSICFSQLGNLAKSDEYAEQAMAIEEQYKLPSFQQLGTISQCAYVRFRRQQYASSLKLAEQGLVLARTQKERRTEIELLVLVAQIQLQTGNPKGAHKYLHDAASIYFGSGSSDSVVKQDLIVLVSMVKNAGIDETELLNRLKK